VKEFGITKIRWYVNLFSLFFFFLPLFPSPSSFGSVLSLILRVFDFCNSLDGKSDSIDIAGNRATNISPNGSDLCVESSFKSDG
jgi:hypothetical protein